MRIIKNCLYNNIHEKARTFAIFKYIHIFSKFLFSNSDFQGKLQQLMVLTKKPVCILYNRQWVYSICLYFKWCARTLPANSPSRGPEPCWLWPHLMEAPAGLGLAPLPPGAAGGPWGGRQGTADPVGESQSEESFSPTYITTHTIDTAVLSWGTFTHSIKKIVRASEQWNVLKV